MIVDGTECNIDSEIVKDSLAYINIEIFFLTRIRTKYECMQPGYKTGGSDWFYAIYKIIHNCFFCVSVLDVIGVVVLRQYYVIEQIGVNKIKFLRVTTRI